MDWKLYHNVPAMWLIVGEHFGSTTEWNWDKSHRLRIQLLRTSARYVRSWMWQLFTLPSCLVSSFYLHTFKGVFIATQLNWTQLRSKARLWHHKQKHDWLASRWFAVRCSTGSVQLSSVELSCVAINIPLVNKRLSLAQYVALPSRTSLQLSHIRVRSIKYATYG